MAAQGIKQRLDFDADDPRIDTFAIRPFEIVNGLFVFTEGQMNQCKGERPDVSLRGLAARVAKEGPMPYRVGQFLHILVPAAP